MKIIKEKGNHSERDEIIRITADDEAIRLQDYFDLTKAFALNELIRIRSPLVRNQIINGERPFLFENKIKLIFDYVKQTELELMKGGK